MLYLINFSGHPAPRGAEGFLVVDVPSPSKSAPLVPEVAAAALEMLGRTEEDPAAAEALRRGEAQLILPGYSPLATALVAAAAGRMGRLPSVRWGIRRRNSYVLSAPLDLQGLRNRMRANR
ncbi:MAG: CRISPR-associated protein Csx15 [Moorellales bacterium]